MLRICVVGSGGVGKSSVTLRYLRNEFTEYYDPTMEEAYQIQMTSCGRKHEVEIVDTAGQEEFISFLDSSLATGEAFLILYAINSLSSWNHLKALRAKIIRETEGVSRPVVPMVIIGNKRDLEEEREVPQKEAEEFAEKVKTPYLETSAKTGYNVQDAFQLIMNQVERLKPELLMRRNQKSKNKPRNKKDCSIA